ncbi:MAG: hypothetical protein ACI4TD_07460 [Phocaeicola sp.]
MGEENNNKDVQNNADQTGTQGGTTGVAGTQQNNQQVSQQQTQQQTTEKMFSQAQVNHMMANEKKQGRAAAFNEMGINPNDPNAANMINMFKAFVSSMKTDEQKAQEQTAAQQIALAESQSKLQRAELKAEALQLGANPEFVDDIVTIAVSKMSDKTDAKTVIGELKTKYSVWFTPTAPEDNDDKGKGQKQQNNNQQNNNGATGQNGTGTSVGNGSKKAGTDKGTSSLGTRLAAQRNQATQKKSFWS